MDDRWLELTGVLSTSPLAERYVFSVRASAVSAMAAVGERTAIFSGGVKLALVKESIDDIKAAMGIFPVKVSRGK